MNFDLAFDRLVSHEGEIARIENILRRALYEESSKNATAVYTPINSRAYDCAIKNCFNKAYAKGLCNAHYVRQRNGVSMDFPVRNRKRGVSCIECGESCDAKGGWMRCRKHFKVRRSLVIKTAAIAALGGRCMTCSVTYPSQVFDFHHKADKDFSIGNEGMSRSIAALASELAKCELLCANCHRMEHYGGL